jgi:hypothetical protein
LRGLLRPAGASRGGLAVTTTGLPWDRLADDGLQGRPANGYAGEDPHLPMTNLKVRIKRSNLIDEIRHQGNEPEFLTNLE